VEKKRRNPAMILKIRQSAIISKIPLPIRQSMEKTRGFLPSYHFKNPVGFLK
jgi:hypothetical protein